MIKCPQQVTEKTQWTVFLAGPMNGAPSWQAQAPKVAEKVGIENLTLLNPRKEKEQVHHIPGPMFEPMGKLSRQIQANTNRNQTLMEHWNQTVAPGDTVYLDGEFGAEEWKPFLNGNII